MSSTLLFVITNVKYSYLYRGFEDVAVVVVVQCLSLSCIDRLIGFLFYKQAIRGH